MVQKECCFSITQISGSIFSQTFHPNGTKIFSARVIPFKGAWMEFATDINSVMYAYIDRKKKFPVTTLLGLLVLIQIEIY
jgi:DNA-directed RNA polymerase beta subunit